MTSIVRLDSVSAVYGDGHIHSLQSEEVVQNGQVGVAGNLLEGEREVRHFEQADDLATAKAVLVAHDEINYDESRRTMNNLNRFQIEPGTPFRAYDLHENDVFSVSADAIDALGDAPKVGNMVTMQTDSNKLAEGTDGGTARFVGRIEALEKVGVPTYVGKPGIVGGVIDFVVIRVLSN